MDMPVLARDINSVENRAHDFLPKGSESYKNSLDMISQRKLGPQNVSLVSMHKTVLEEERSSVREIELEDEPDPNLEAKAQTLKP